jgi:hypothetical protein
MKIIINSATIVELSTLDIVFSDTKGGVYKPLMAQGLHLGGQRGEIAP